MLKIKMEPVTHFLSGACMGRAGCNRMTRYATLAMVLAAEAPDMDVLWSLRGPVAGFEHHRGITHTFLGAPFMALLVTAAVYGWHRWRTRKQTFSADAKRELPIRWGLIWLLALIADLVHILLDWTNNYGVRPFFPFNPHWYAGSIFFIIEPILLAALGLALILPALLGLADLEIGARRTQFRGQGWAIFALCIAVVLGCWKWAEHERALHLAEQQNYQNETPLRIMVNPYPGSPFHWFAVVETPDFFETAQINTRTGEFLTQAPAGIAYKQPVTPAIAAAKNSWLGRVYLDWAKFPLVTEADIFDILPNGSHYTRVQFQDLRFAYNAAFLQGRKNPPLSGEVIVAPNGEIDEMRMENRVQK